MSFIKLLTTLMKGVEGDLIKVQKGIADFKTLLLAQDQIRFYVDRTDNFGHQASTVHVMKRLIDFSGYSKKITIYYAEIPDSTATANKLANLLTGLDPRIIDTACITYGTCSDITFVKYDKQVPVKKIPLGFTGGADEEDEYEPDDSILNLATALNTKYFLRLQPFAWRYIDREDDNIEKFEVNRIEPLDAAIENMTDIGKESDIFKILAYLFESEKCATVSAETWSWYKNIGFNPDLKKSTQIAYELYSAIGERADIVLQPVYGIHQFDQFPEDAGQILINIILAARTLQKTKTAPIIIPIFNKKSQNVVSTPVKKFVESLDAFKLYLKNTYNPQNKGDETPIGEKIKAALQTVEALYTSLAINTSVTLLDSLDASLIKPAIDKLKAGQVLIILVENVPRDVYNYFYSKSGIPCIFEGQGTSSLVISQGVPYFQLPRVSDSAYNYPSLSFRNEDYSARPAECNALAKTITITLRALINVDNLTSPNQLTANIGAIARFMSDSITVGTTTYSYFKALGAFYSDPTHDKLLLGCAYFNSIVSAASVDHVVQRLGVRLNDNNPLATVYQQLTAAWHTDSLDLLAALPDTYLADYYSAITGARFDVKVAQADIVSTTGADGNVTQVIVRNARTDAFQLPFALELTFSIVKGLVVSNLRCRAPDNWSLDGAPWLGFEEPGFDMRVTEAAIPVQGAIVANVIGTGLGLRIGYPVYNNQWSITGGFDKPYPSIAGFFQMAGGINLVQVLPPPLNALAGVGLSQAQLGFDATAKSVTSTTFTLTTDAAWNLISVPRIEVTPTLSVTVINPADLKNRRIQMTASGVFKIGDGLVMINAQYPDFQVNGRLAGGVIQLSDLVKLFGADIDLAAQVSEFSMQVLPPTGKYSVDTAITSNWPISIAGTTLFTITGMGFHVAGGKSSFDVKLSGAVIILPDRVNLALALSAAYQGKGKGWLFEGKQTSEVLALGDLLNHYLGWDTKVNLQIKGLALSLNTSGSAWSFSARTASAWTVPFIPELSVSASFKAGYLAAAPAVKGALRLVGGTAARHPSGETTGHFARLETDWTWQGINIQVWFDYNPAVNTYGITWGILKGSVSSPDKVTGDRVALLSFTDNVTLGSIIATMVTWMTGTAFSLDAPWNVLDNINLSNIGLKYIFNSKDKSRNKVTFNVKIGPIDLGFARIDGIDIGYQSTGPQRGVMVTLNGSFPWNIGNEALGNINSLGPWDASKPGTAPAPSGNGNKYFDLRLLALGQHVTAPGFATAQTVQQAIAVMRDLPDAEFGKIPQIAFDASSDWLVGMEFGVLKLGDESKNITLERGLNESPAEIAEGVLELLNEQIGVRNKSESSGYAVTLQVIFNDPRIYGLRIALEGEPAKIFKGLDFQIMYRQISDTVGVYQAEIALPDVMRFISVGAYSITLPVFAIAIYTNGDFQVDIGFPWNADFTRSFSIEAIIYPGIPVLGSAGFYFGKLSSATTNRVPKIFNGTFNPVLVFGFGLQVGFGKSIRYGILSAGFSLTAVGILEGVIAKFNPYQLTGPDSNNKQVQGAYYFWLRGTVGIIGKVFGTIDFAIIKANVNVEVRLLLELTYESYVSIAMTVLASVDVSVSVKIDLGLFSISISFSFSMRLKETFTIKNGGKSPWLLANDGTRNLRARSPDFRLRALRAVAQSQVTPTWSNLQPAASKVPLSGYASVGLTMARDEWGSRQQLPCYVAMLFIDSAAAANVDRTSAALKAAGNQLDSSFETLAKMVLRWAIASLHGSPVDAATLDATPVSDVLLADLADRVLATDNTQPTPIDADDFASFLAAQFEFTIGLPPVTPGEADAAFFPMPGGAQLTIPAYGKDYSGCDYRFADYNQVSTEALAGLRSYFDDLAIKVQQESDPGMQFNAVRSGQTLSMAQWIFADYALLLARQMVQVVREALRDYKYLIVPGQTADQIVRWVNQNIGIGHDLYERSALFTSNANHPLSTGQSLTLGQTCVVSAQTGNSFAQVAETTALTPFALAAANSDVGQLFTPGRVISYPDKPDYTLQANDNLLDIARQFSVLLADLLNHSNLLRLSGLLVNNATLRVPTITYQSQIDDSFTTIANLSIYKDRFNARTLALVNSAQAILRTGASITFAGQPSLLVQPGDTLGDLANRLKNVSIGQFIEGSDLLTLKDLFLPVAQLQLPSMVVQIEAGQTLSSIAQFFGTNVQTLADTAANGTVSDLFAVSDSSGTASPTLDITHLPAFTLSELISEAQRCHALQHLSGMASRYYLHGLRLQTDNIVPMKPGMWVRNGKDGLELPELMGLFALTGQQFPLPVISADSPFSLALKTSAALPWLKFQDASKAPTDSLTLNIAAGSDDANRISSLAIYATSGLDIALEHLGAADMAQSKLATYSCSSPIAWQCAAAVALPYGAPPSGVAAMRLWRLPDALCALPDPASRAIDPRLSVKLAQYDEANGATRETPANAYGWASNLSFAVKKIPPTANSPASATTYEIAGADGADITLLERLLTAIGSNDSAFYSLSIGYAPDQSGPAAQGVETAAPAGVTLGIAQVNLSTETRPPAQAFNALLRQDDGSGLGLLNKPTEFVRLLWEASITRSGGFFLYYYDAQQGAGLPDRLFNDRGEATLSLILIYSKPALVPLQNRVGNFINTLVTADAFDASNIALYAEADPARSPPDTCLANAQDTLASIAYRYFSDAGELAEANAGLKLAVGTNLTVSEGVYRIPVGTPQPLAVIAQRLGCTIDALQAANGNRLTDPLSYPQAVRLPPLSVSVSDSQNTTLNEIATRYGQSVIALAGQNLNLPGLFQGQTLNISGGPTLRNATVPPGVVSMAALRAVPPSVPLKPDNGNDADYAKALLLNVYNLLNYRVAANNGFTASHLGLPAGPTSTPQNPQSQDKVAIARALAPGDKDWNYQQAVPFSTFAKNRTSDSPYSGIGEILQVEFNWQDLYGNVLLTGLSDPSVGSGAPLNYPPLLVGYSDALIGLGQWPSVSSRWQLLPDTSTNAKVQLNLSFDNGQFRGVLQATAQNASSIVVQFTDTLLPATAVNPDNYRLDGGSVLSAILEPDNRSVVLTVDPLVSGAQYSLSINNLITQNQQAISGQTGFSYPQQPSLRSSTVQQNAVRALRVFKQLQLQLNDPNGISWNLETSLLQPDAQGNSARLPLPPAQITQLTDWLFGTRGILAMLTDRAAFGLNTAPPDAGLTLSVALPLDALNRAQIFSLDTSLCMARMGGTVLEDLATTVEIRRNSTRLTPDQSAVSSTSKTLVLDTFAKNLTAALQVPGVQFSLATGGDRYASSQSNRALWVVRVGLDKAQPIAYTIDTAGTGKPSIFAPRPISNSLESRKQVPIRNYVTGTGISPQTSRTLDFIDIDLDAWGRLLFRNVDDTLTPSFTAAMEILARFNNTDYLAQLLAVKKAFASIAKLWMVPVFEDDDSDPAPAQEAFYQQLLGQLSNAYTVRASIGYKAQVNAAVSTPAPRLFGAVVSNPLFTNAVINTADPTRLTLYFNLRMSSEAGDPKWYSLPGGPQVLAAVASGDGTQISLTLAAATEAGAQVQVCDTFTDAQGYALKPPYSLPLTTNPPILQPNGISLSSPKLELASGDENPMVFLVSAPDLVRGSEGEIVKSVELDLRFQASDIEHQIGKLPNIEDYQASSWLRLALPAQGAPLNADLGAISVPLVLRTFPTTPTLSQQQGSTHDSATDLNELVQWTYAFTYNLPCHYPQDRVYGSVAFNAAKSVGFKAFQDAFAPLAQFITVYPAVYQDLEHYLAGIDATTDQVKDATAIKNATVALNSAITLLTEVAGAADGSGLILAGRTEAWDAQDSLTFSFYIEEDHIEYNDIPGVLRVSLAGAIPAGLETPWVDVAPDVYTPVLLDNDGSGRLSYVYRNLKYPALYLSAQVGQLISERTLRLPGAHILQRQSATTHLYLKRNLELVPNRPSASPFVYQTPEVEFSNPLFPQVDSSQPFPIEKMGTAAAGATYNRSLTEQLQALFDTLLASSTQPSITVQVEATYTYNLNPNVSGITVTLPIAMQAPMKSTVQQLPQMVSVWSSAIQSWFDNQPPNGDGGTLWFDLSLMSDLTRQPMPLLRLRKLSLALSAITPSLPVT
jgi:LysM repeat protein